MDKGSIGLDTIAISLTLTPPNIRTMSANSAFSNNRRIDEVDFFSDERKNAQEKRNKVQPLSMKTEDLSINTGLRLVTENASSGECTDDACISRSKDDKGKGEAVLESLRKENQRLRGVLKEVTDNYNALQMQLFTFMEQQEQRNNGMKFDRNHRNSDGVVQPKFAELSLAVGMSENEEKSSSSTEAGSLPNSGSPVASMDRAGSTDEMALIQPTGKLPKLIPVRRPSSMIVEETHEETMKKARVSVRARSEAPMISDGCQWRKYGQKMAKGNPCPRAYYRCTMAAGCPVRKQVQRCAEDRSILITTYEGNHNHQLPPAATAMASTTSAAASMLLSGSMPSSDQGIINPNFLAKTVLPHSSNITTISASTPFPTITLDLTRTPTLLQHYQQPSSYQLMGNQSMFSGLHSSSRQATIDTLSKLPSSSSTPPVSLADAVSAAITSDPNFTTVLATAITTIMGVGSSNNPEQQQQQQEHMVNVSAVSTTNNNKIEG